MVFSFKDGSQLEVEPSRSHSFIQNDLAWATVARGGLTHISYQSGDRAHVERKENRAANALSPAQLQPCKSCQA